MPKSINSTDTYKHHMEKITITLPMGTKEKAHGAGINISKVCSIAVSEAIGKMTERSGEKK